MVSRQVDAKRERLTHVPLFAACSTKELLLAASLVDEAIVPAGSVLTRQGTPGTQCFVIVQGEATATLDGIWLARLGPGDVVGEMALLDDQPRSATVVADSELRLLVLTRDGLERLLVQIPVVTRCLLRALALRLRAIEGAPRS